MTPKQIKRRLETLTKRSNAVKLEILQLQESCMHVNKLGILGSNTENWCKSDDTYWVDHTCSDCGKYWRDYQ